jgi:hypothetical protein
VTAERLVHHELCFGCGRTNLFGLLMELEHSGERAVRGRGFIKQDHQGARRGAAHPGIVAAALTEAMAFAAGPGREPASVRLELREPAPVGSYLEVEARAGDPDGDPVEVEATAWAEDQPVARAGGTYRRA